MAIYSMHALFCLLTFSLIQFVPAAEADVMKNHGNRSDEPTFVQKSMQLQPWLSQLEKSFRGHRKYNRLIASYLSDTRSVESVIAHFLLTKSGRIVNPKILHSSGSSKFDDNFLAFIEKSEPGLLPVNELPTEEGIKVMLFKGKLLSHDSKDHAFLGCFPNRY